MSARGEIIESVRRSISAAVGVVQEALPPDDVLGACPKSERWEDDWGTRNAILRGYRDLHLLFAGETAFPEWALQAEKVLRVVVEAVGFRTRFEDALSSAAGTFAAVPANDFTCGTIEEAKEILDEAYILSPDCVMLTPECVSLRARMHDPVPIDVVSLQGDPALAGDATSSTATLLPAGMSTGTRGPVVAGVAPPPSLPPLGITVDAPLYDLMLVRAGTLHLESGFGTWDGHVSRTDALDARANFAQSTAAGATAGTKQQQVLVSVPFEPLPVVGPPSAAVLSAVRQRFVRERGMSAGVKRAGEQMDPDGKVPYEVDGDFPLDRIVTGIVLQPGVVDLSHEPIGSEGGEVALAKGDVLDTEQIKLTMYWWMAHTHGRMTYIHTLNDGKEIREECPVLACWQAGLRGEQWGEKEVHPGTWLLTVWARADWVWEAIQSKKIRAFSIGYVGYYRLEEPLTVPV